MEPEKRSKREKNSENGKNILKNVDGLKIWGFED
jgi:hypothetical protein